MKCKLKPSKHAIYKMVETGISVNEVTEGILKGAKRSSEGKIITFFRGLEVVYKQFPCNHFVITVYWKRKR